MSLTQVDKSFPKWDVSVTAETSVNPSEDPDKVIQCLVNTLNGGTPRILNSNALVTGKGIHSLHHIRVGVKSRLSEGVLRRLLELNRRGNTTWFLINKQAAHSGSIALVEDWDESSLGPITVTIDSKDLDKVIDWLVPSTVKPNSETE
jgi:predicted RNA binding protein with dsRBD fold (UPF0201 family)